MLSLSMLVSSTESGIGLLSTRNGPLRSFALASQIDEGSVPPALEVILLVSVWICVFEGMVVVG